MKYTMMIFVALATSAFAMPQFSGLGNILGAQTTPAASVATPTMDAAVAPAAATTAATGLSGPFANNPLGSIAAVDPSSTGTVAGLTLPTALPSGIVLPSTLPSGIQLPGVSGTPSAVTALPGLPTALPSGSALPTALPAISFPSISLPSGFPVLGAAQPASSAATTPAAVTPASA
ncbi:hypothetical protein E5Q_05916 [Mixia osmundae IAM 14324]|uniref:Uncharacterized protein n=2 Tax=Mixia osmundae (strain CBS 9802 / IAM 14324 / JCM 22182 / KY 12970) TaxID=764103 RepID=G7E9A4_MIXOS|nr:hypothetical protein E5Q_05916 [Mixia osmundae IAM 14324]